MRLSIIAVAALSLLQACAFFQESDTIPVPTAKPQPPKEQDRIAYAHDRYIGLLEAMYEARVLLAAGQFAGAETKLEQADNLLDAIGGESPTHVLITAKVNFDRSGTLVPVYVPTNKSNVSFAEFEDALQLMKELAITPVSFELAQTHRFTDKALAKASPLSQDMSSDEADAWVSDVYTAFRFDEFFGTPHVRVKHNVEAAQLLYDAGFYSASQDALDAADEALLDLLKNPGEAIDQQGQLDVFASRIQRLQNKISAAR